jgi:hypothetical protein
MHHVGFSHGLHALDNLRENLDRLILLKFGLGGNIFRQISPFTVFEENVEICWCFFDIDKVDDVVVLAVVEEVDFSLKNFNFII